MMFDSMIISALFNIFRKRAIFFTGYLELRIKTNHFQFIKCSSISDLYEVKFYYVPINLIAILTAFFFREDNDIETCLVEKIWVFGLCRKLRLTNFTSVDSDIYDVVILKVEIYLWIFFFTHLSHWIYIDLYTS